MKKQFMALVMALLVCVGYSGALVPATAYAADSIGYVDLNKVFSNHPDFASARAAMSLEQQKAQQSGAAAQVAHPKPRLQPGKAAQQKGVGTGLEQAVIADEGESAGAEEFPVLQVDPPIG